MNTLPWESPILWLSVVAGVVVATLLRRLFRQSGRIDTLERRVGELEAVRDRSDAPADEYDPDFWKSR